MTHPPEEVLSGFFSFDLPRVLAAVSAMQEPGSSHGAVTRLETMARRGATLHFDEGGLFSEEIFGPSGAGERRWGHVDVAGVVHPVVAMGGEVATEPSVVRAILRGELVLRGEELVPFSFYTGTEDGDLTGPAAIVALLVARDPAHPLLPLCTITKIPLPPPDARPLLRDLAPTMVDPWLGPANLAWLSLIERAKRELRLAELGASSSILQVESLATQRAFQDVFDASMPADPLVPPLAHMPDSVDETDVFAIAFVRADVLVVQRASGVHIIGDDGRVLRTAPPAGCQLVGVLDDRIAIFQDYLMGLDPIFLEDVSCWDGFAIDDESGVRRTKPHAGALSALDCETGEYLVDVPAGLPPNSLQSGEPEDLFFTDPKTGKRHRLHVGGDRPGVLASTRDLRFAWVGEAGSTTEVLEVATGITQVHPAIPEEDTSDYEEHAAAAVAFRDGRWHFLWSTGLYADHEGERAFRVAPSIHAAAFDPSGARLAVITDEEIVITDVEQRVVVRRFALPGSA